MKIKNARDDILLITQVLRRIISRRYPDDVGVHSGISYN
jgi:hypothetical protein